MNRNSPCLCGSGKKYKNCCLGKKPFTPPELLESLKEQISFLQSSNTLFDSGNLIEAKRLALTLRILLHDTNQSHALIPRIDNSLLFLNTSSSRNSNGIKMFFSGLTSEQLNHEPGKPLEFKFVPKLDSFPPSSQPLYQDFTHWWNESVIIDEEENQFSRADLILFVANQDGGAHVDREVPTDYYELSRKNKTGIQLYTGNPVEPESMVYRDIDSRPHYPSIRQISHEVIQSIKNKYPDLIF